METLASGGGEGEAEICHSLPTAGFKSVSQQPWTSSLQAFAAGSKTSTHQLCKTPAFERTEACIRQQMDPVASSCMRGPHPPAPVWGCLRNPHSEGSGASGLPHYPPTPFSFHQKPDFPATATAAYPDFSASCLAATPHSLPREERGFTEQHPAFPQPPDWHFPVSEARHRLNPGPAGGSKEMGASSPGLVDTTGGPGEDYEATPLRSPPEGLPVLEKVREAGSKGQALDLRMQVKPCSALEQQRPDDGADLLVQTPAKVHLLLVGGTCCFLISPWDPTPPPQPLSLPIHLLSGSLSPPCSEQDIALASCPHCPTTSS
eukprot:bmy_15243T0